MSLWIDLDADLGEGMGDDDAMLEIVSSASIACGGHAGDAATMARLFARCRNRGVRIGAHPGFADKARFGRVRLALTPAEMAAEVLAQLALARDVAARVGASIAYLKLHGAMANMAAEDEALAATLFAAVAEAYPGLAVLALAGSGQARAAHRLGLEVIAEAYADRAYRADGQLVDRQQPGAVLHDTDAIVARCVRLAKTGHLVTLDGHTISAAAHSICIHGDTPGALALSRAVADGLAGAGVTIAATGPV